MRKRSASILARALRFMVARWAPDHRGIVMLERAGFSRIVGVAIPCGTHGVMIDRVDAVRLSDKVQPLIYQDGMSL